MNVIATYLCVSVVLPVIRAADRPHQALPWEDVQRILSAIDRTSRIGRRDYALLLMMGLYGLGAGEVTGVRLEDVNWRGNKLIFSSSSALWGIRTSVVGRPFAASTDTLRVTAQRGMAWTLPALFSAGFPRAKDASR
jgi:integrase